MEPLSLQGHAELKHLKKLLRQCKDIHDALVNSSKSTQSSNSFNHAQITWRKVRKSIVRMSDIAFVQ
eukprot:4574096-Karenia_brevis.AAC.1